jgi:hypothetical protein
VIWLFVIAGVFGYTGWINWREYDVPEGHAGMSGPSRWYQFRMTAAGFMGAGAMALVAGLVRLAQHVF